jgi:hypothetical protein
MMVSLSNNPPATDVDRDIRAHPYHEALSALLEECAGNLQEPPTNEELPNASSVRSLQDKLQDFVASDNVPPDIQFAVFLIDKIVSDVFENFFGDALSSEESDQSRRSLFHDLSKFFSELSGALARVDEHAQIACFTDFVFEYLRTVRRLNASWIDQHPR